jgi:hypothetical protein
MTMAKKEIAIKATTELTTDVLDLMGAMGDVDPKDLSIPTLLMVQNVSSYLDGTVKAGALLNKDTLQVLGGEGVKVPFVPLFHFKSYAINEILGGTNSWLREEPDTGQVYDCRYKVENLVDKVVDGKVEKTKAEVDLVFNFYLMAVEDLSDPMALPYLLKLKRTSAKEAKKLLTRMSMARGAKVEPWSLIFNLDTVLVKGDKGPYYEASITPVTEGANQVRITDDKLMTSRKWAKTIIEGQSILKAKKMAESDEEHIKAPAPQGNVQNDSLGF